MTAGADVPSQRRTRRALTAALVVVATVGLLVAGHGGAPVGVRLVAACGGLVAGAISLVTARRKGDLLGWYAIAIALLLLRLLS